MAGKVRQRKSEKSKKEFVEKNRKTTESRSASISLPSLFISILLLILVFASIVISLVLWKLPCPINPVALTQQHDLPVFDGAMTPNTVLQNVEKIGTDKLPGPESIQIDSKGVIYTGLKDGRIVKVTKTGEVIELVRVGQKVDNCGEPDVEHICGRPLGLQFDKDEKNLIICDAYFGLLSLNIESNFLTVLLSASVGVEDIPFKFTNHLAISSSGKIYFTDSSWNWHRRDFPYIMLEGGGGGRLISFDPATNKTEVLLSGIYFANGVVISPKEDFVLVSETAKARITRVWLSGVDKGIYDIFTDNLPGYPDNLRLAKKGGYWLALGSVRKWPFSFLDLVGPYPEVKAVIAKVLSKESFLNFVKSYGLIVRIDEDGDIVESYHDPTGSTISHISEVYENSNGDLYLGSYKQNYMAKLKLDSSSA